MLIDLFALDGLEQIGQITGYSEVEITERDLNVGSWTVKVPATDRNTSLLYNWRAATNPGLEAVDRETGWRFGGYVTEQRLTKNVQGVTFGMGGVDFAAELQQRLQWPNPYDASTIWAPVPIPERQLTTAIHNLVAYQCGPLASEARRIPDLASVQVNDPAAGGVIQAMAEAKPLLEVIAGWATNSDYTARLELLRRPGGSAVLHFHTPFRYRANMQLSLDTGSVGEFEIVQQAAPVETLIGTGAAIDGVTPETRAYQSNPRHYLTRDWQYRYSEGYRDFPAAGVNELFTEMLGWRAETAAKTTYKVSDVPLSNYSSLSNDVGIGWRIPVSVSVAGETTSLELPLSASTATYSPDRGWQRTATLGDDLRTGLGRVMQLLTDTTRRIRRLESG